MPTRQRWWPACALLIFQTCQADSLLERVVDGDTVIIREEGARYRLRLMDIDAPELHQAYGKQSQRSLRQLCQTGPISVEKHGQDRYGRTLGYVYCQGTNSSDYQIRQGMAWFNHKYSQRPVLEASQQQAQQAALGLWQQPQPVPPWVWRAQHGKQYRLPE